MFLKYGDYQHPDNEIALTITSERLRNEALQGYGLRHRWTIQGVLHGDTVAELTTKIAALELAYKERAKPLALYVSAGVLTAHAVDAGSGTLQSFSGVEVVSGPVYPDSSGAEYTTYRKYQIELEFQTVDGGQIAYLSWQQSLALSGGGPRFVYLQPILGLPQKQQVAESTPYNAVQQGSAIGILSYPPVPQPLFPDSEHRDRRQINRLAPRRQGNSNLYYQVDWYYEFESHEALSGTPGAWPGI